jgi:uncharacterized protein with FMN-binding domain
MTPAKKRGSINLTALGSAAVVAVYAAGYLRTRPAAQRFEERNVARRPAPAAPAPVVIDAARLMDTIRKDSLRRSAPVTSAAKKKKPESSVAPADTGKREVPVAIKDSATAPAAPAPAPSDTAKTAVADSVKVRKDGIYAGWGTSRHGDIEAAVEIRGGRIVKAIITQCLTRYSCSRIAAIIPQVVERQSPEVDFVSGATESTNAFYYAIVEALSKAK